MTYILSMLRAIDLCAGVGGFHWAAKGLPIQFVYANDFEPHCKETYELNFGHGSLNLQNLCNVPSTQIPDHDLLCAGFPCQPYSIAGEKKGFNDTRAEVFFKIVDILGIKKPKYFLLENVKNLVSHDKGKSLQKVLSLLTEQGYVVYNNVLRSQDFGIPQNRERIFFVGIRNDLTQTFVYPLGCPLNVVPESLIDSVVDAKYYYTDLSVIIDKLRKTVTDHIKTGQIYQYRRYYVRDNKNGICPTLTANMGTGGHNVPIILDDVGIRKLTPRECFRLQGFSDDFKLPSVGDAHLYKQAGNSVTIPVITALLQEIQQHYFNTSKSKTCIQITKRN